jgi:hypothetical protein
VTDHAISLTDYVRSLRAAIPTDAGIHPSAMCIIREWLAKAESAAERGDGAEVARLADNITDKATEEAAWYQFTLSGRPITDYYPKAA